MNHLDDENADDRDVLDSSGLDDQNGSLPLVNKFKRRMALREQQGLPAILPAAVPKLAGYVKNTIEYACESVKNADLENPLDFFERKKKEQRPPLPVYTGPRLGSKDGPIVRQPGFEDPDSGNDDGHSSGR